MITLSLAAMPLPDTAFPGRLATSTSGSDQLKPTPCGCGGHLRRLVRRAVGSRLSPESFTEPDVVYQIGLPPNRIDFLTSIDGVEFDAAWPERVRCKVDGVEFSLLSLKHLLTNKRATGRPQDLADVARLMELTRADEPR